MAKLPSISQRQSGALPPSKEKFPMLPIYFRANNNKYFILIWNSDRILFSFLFILDQYERRKKKKREISGTVL